MEESMLKRVALLAPFALIVAAAACGVESSSGEDDQGAPQANSVGEALTHTGGGVQPPIGSVPPGGGGVQPPIGSVPPGGGVGVQPPIGSVPPGGGVGVQPPIGSVPPDVGVQPPIGSVPPGGGVQPPIGSVPPGGGGVRPPIGSVPPGAGGVRPGVGWGRGRGLRRGWVNGRWAPGWGWNQGVWVVGGTVQYPCTTDFDCAVTLGPRVAVCDFEPTVGLGQCVAPNWFYGP
jgi:hypothetical protein